MTSLLFNNLLKMKLVEDIDIVVYYNNHLCKNGLEICKDLDDCFSVLIDAKIIDEDEIKDDVINYYNTHFKNNKNKIINLINTLNNKSEILF